MHHVTYECVMSCLSFTHTQIPGIFASPILNSRNIWSDMSHMNKSCLISLSLARSLSHSLTHSLTDAQTQTHRHKFASTYICGLSPIDAVSQCVAMWCSVLQCVAVCRSVVHCVAVCCSALQYVPVCCRMIQCIAA